MLIFIILILQPNYKRNWQIVEKLENKYIITISTVLSYLWPPWPMPRTTTPPPPTYLDKVSDSTKVGLLRGVWLVSRVQFPV